MSTFTVVIVDDVATLRTLVRLVLERSGRFHVVAEGANGHEAVELAARHRPDLVLLDISMPERDGLEALPDVLAAAPDAKVVILSGFEPKAMQHPAASLGAHAYLEKGIEPDELVAALLKVLEDTVEP